MYTPLFISKVPLWALLLITVIITIIIFEIAYRFGKYRKNRRKNISEPAAGPIIGATLGLLSLVLAFTFNISAGLFQERFRLVLDDVNAIETAYLRTSYISEKNKIPLRDLLRKYIKVRSEIHDLKSAEQETKQLMNQIWDEVTKVAKEGIDSDLISLFVQSFNEMFNVNTKRVMIGGHIHIPPFIWFILYLITLISMAAIGYYTGLVGRQSVFIILAMIFTFSVIICLIADLDYSDKGVLNITQQPMKELLERISIN